MDVVTLGICLNLYFLSKVENYTFYKKIYLDNTLPN